MTCSVCNGPSTDHNCMEYLTGRVRELEEVLRILHFDCCYNLSDDRPEYFQPDRPKAETFNLVERVLSNKE